MAGTAAGATPDQIDAAIRAGWMMATARTHLPAGGKTRAPQPEKPLRGHLPAASEISGSEQREILFGQISSCLALIGAEKTGVCMAAYATWKSEEFGQKLDDAFVKLRIELASKDPQLDEALSLEHVLADTVLLPERKNMEQIAHSFGPERLKNVHGWLGDLHRCLPTGAADAVSRSLRSWEGYVADQLAEKPPMMDEQFVPQLHRQGKLWLQLLCGDKLVEDQLKPDHYSRAAARLARTLASTTRSYFKEWWWLLLPLVVFVTAGLAAVVFLPGDQKLIGLLAGLLGAAGISWKTIGSSLGRIFTALEKPLWEAEKKEAAAEACTLYVPHRSAPEEVRPEASAATAGQLQQREQLAEASESGTAMAAQEP